MGRVAPRMVPYPNYRNRYHRRRNRRGRNNIGLPLFYRQPRHLPPLSWLGGGSYTRKRNIGGRQKRFSKRNHMAAKEVAKGGPWVMQAMAALHFLTNHFRYGK